MEKINIAELLKDCPTGMELDCTMFENVTLVRVDTNKRQFPIEIAVSGSLSKYLTKEGCFHDRTQVPESKCIIFPKGKTTWEGFQRPFKDGDILATNLGSVFFLNTHLNTDEYYGCYVGIGSDGSFHICEPFAYKECCGLATENEKQKLFKAIKDNGYKWNEETKALEKLITPKFKVGDRIKYKNGVEQGVILSITDNTYYDVAVTNNIGISVRIIDQDEWELIPNKFDINTLIPFESKVLVRHDKDNKWTGSFFSFIDRDLNSHCYKFVTTADKSYPMMIPYKGNEYLLGKVEDCKDFYKIWE